MKLIRRILVGIKNTEARTQPAAEKAAQLAHIFGASLELFHAIGEPAQFPLTGSDAMDERARRRDWHLGHLQMLGSRLCEVAGPVSAQADWATPAHEAIVRRAIEIKADLIVVDSPARSRWARWLLHLTDWELLRTSPVPVLLVKTRELYESPIVLAAVDPMHAHAKPSRLDEAILRYGNELARTLSGSLHVAHARPPLPLDIPPSEIVSDSLTAALDARLETRARSAFARCVKKAGIPRARQHFVNGTPSVVLPETARTLGADLVVMGAVSRSGLRRIFIGNTAERVLNDLHTDVLVINTGGIRRAAEPARKHAGARRHVARAVQ